MNRQPAMARGRRVRSGLLAGLAGWLLAGVGCTAAAKPTLTDPTLTFASSAPSLQTLQRNINLSGAGGGEVALETALARQFRPRRDRAAWALVYPLDWAADPFHDPNWQFQLHAWRMIDPLILAYTNTPSPTLLARVVEVASDWQRFHLIEGKDAAYSNYDMSLGIRAQKIAWLVRALHDAGDQATLDAVALPLARDALATLEAQYPFSTNNHGLFQMHGLMALCRVLDGPACVRGRATAESEFVRLLDQQFLADGIQSEHSPGYHFFSHATFARLVRSGWYEGAAEADGRLDLARAEFAWLVDPAGLLFTVGDTDPVPPPIAAALDGGACELARDPVCVRYRHFQAAGWVIARTASEVAPEHGSALFVQGGHHSSVHKHLDDLSVIWFDRGQPVLVDPGKYAYVDNALRSYFLSTRAHNTVEIDRTNQSAGGEAAYGSAIRAVTAQDGVLHVEAQVTHAKLATEHQREIVYAPNRYLEITDRLHASLPREFVHWLQFPPGSTASAAEQPGDVTRLSLPSGDKLLILPSRADCDTFVQSGSEQPRLQGWVSTGYGKAVPSLSLGFSCRGTDSTLTVRLAWEHAEPPLLPPATAPDQSEPSHAGNTP